MSQLWEGQVQGTLFPFLPLYSCHLLLQLLPLSIQNVLNYFILSLLPSRFALLSDPFR